MKNWQEIEFLIFDLGNVIYDIDYQRTFEKINSRLPENQHHLIKEFMVSLFILILKQVNQTKILLEMG